MSAFKVKPKRHLRNDIYFLSLMLVVPAAILFVFPYSAVGFVPGSAIDRPVSARCAIVRLDAEGERYALGAARTSWQSGTECVRSLRTDLSAGGLPPAPLAEVIRFRKPRKTPVPAGLLYEPPLLPPSLAAPAPEPIAVESDTAPEASVFPREELLKLD